MQSKGSRKELSEKELKIRFYMKVPILILKGNKARAATEQGRAEKPKYSALTSVWIRLGSAVSAVLCAITKAFNQVNKACVLSYNPFYTCMNIL